MPSFTLVSIILLMYGSLSSRWEQMLVYVQRWFLVGTPLVMSLAVILISLLRLLDVQYVSTVLDATPVGVLFIFIVMMYVAFWFFEYWVNRWLGEEMLEVLGADRKLAAQASCAALSNRAIGRAWASVAGRVVALHGTGRFVAQGWFERQSPAPGERPKDHAFTTYGFVELFEALGASQEQGQDFAHDIRRRMHLYFTLVNILLVAAAVGLLLLAPELVAAAGRRADGARQCHPARAGDGRAVAGRGAREGRHAAPAPARAIRACSGPRSSWRPRAAARARRCTRRWRSRAWRRSIARATWCC